MRTKGSIRAAVGAIMLALVVAGCGGGDSGPGAPALVEKSTAIATGDAICKQLGIDMGPLITAFRQSHPTLTDADARDFLVNTLLPRVDRAVGDIHRIGEPTKDRVPYDEAVIALDKDLSTLKIAVGADPQKVITNKIVIFDKSAKLFTDYGFKECGKS